MPNNQDLDGEDLVTAMNQIRNNSEQQVLRLHEQAQRLVDWREYVRSKPFVAVGAAVVGGYFLLHRSCPKCPKQSTSEAAESLADRKVAKTSLASGAMAFAGSLASQAIRYYAMNQLKTRMGFNDDQPLRRRASSNKPQAWGAESSGADRASKYRNGMRH